MSQMFRIIPRLDVKGPNLVKGIHLEGLRVLGDPEVFAQHYYESGADELFYMDVVASLYGRNSLTDIISKTAKNIFIPITVGGGIRSLADVRRVLHSGADRVCINTAAVKNPEFIKEVASQFGSSTLVVAIEVIKQSNGEYLCFVDNGREHTGLSPFDWAKKVEELGAGEIVLTSVNSEGTGDGFDLELIKMITSSLNIPVIAHGGAGSAVDIEKAAEAGAAAVAVASILHYGVVAGSTAAKSQSSEGNTQFLSSGQSFKKIKPTDIQSIKGYLKEHQIECR
jgi:cyclase